MTDREQTQPSHVVVGKETFNEGGGRSGADGRLQTLHEPNSTCSNPDCGHRMWIGPTKVTPGIEATLIWFCPACKYEMRRDDALGLLEAEFAGEPKTFADFQAQPNVIGTIRAEVKDDD